MIYLTETYIDFAEAARRRKGFPQGLSDSYAWHKAVWLAFPGCDGKSREFLTRLDRKSDGYRLLILSPTAPVRPEWFNPDRWRTKEIPSTYFNHSYYAFQLRVNPTKKVRIGLDNDGTRKKNGKRLPIDKVEDLIQWIQRKGEIGGFRVHENNLIITPGGDETFIRDGKHGTHAIVDYRGILVVTDPPLFLKTMREGLGSAKAFGFGLLIIAPTK